MSEDNLWGEEPFSDIPDEVQLDANNQPIQSAPVRLPRPAIPVPPVSTGINEENYGHAEPSEETENVDEEEQDEDFASVLTDASLRLEQGTLYKLILNHNLFEGSDADPKAVQNVQKEIRKFAKERMEIMLGMRKEVSTVEHLEIDFPFNALEVEVLKKLAFTATKGATQHSDNFVPEVKRTTEEVPNIPKRSTLNPIGSSRKVNTKSSKPLQNKPSAPVKRTKLDLTIDQIAREEGVPRELLEENIPGVGGKPLHKMTEQEILERNRIVDQRRGKQVKSASALPMATEQQQEMLATQHATHIESSPGMAALLAKVKSMPIKN